MSDNKHQETEASLNTLSNMEKIEESAHYENDSSPDAAYWEYQQSLSETVGTETHQSSQSDVAPSIENDDLSDSFQNLFDLTPTQINSQPEEVPTTNHHLASDGIEQSAKTSVERNDLEGEGNSPFFSMSDQSNSTHSEAELDISSADSNSIDNDFAGNTATEAGELHEQANDVQTEPTSATDSPSIPWFLNPIAFISGFVGLLILIIIGVYFSFLSSSSPKKVASSYSNQTATLGGRRNITKQSTTPSSSSTLDLPGNESSIDQLFNGVDSEVKIDNTDYTDQDPITRDTIAKYKTELNQVNNDLDVAQKAYASEQQVTRTLSQDLDAAQKRSSELRKDISDLESKLRWEQEDKKKAQEDLKIALENLDKMRVDLASEKRLTEREKQARLDAEKRYVDLVNSRSDEFLAMTRSMEKLRNEFTQTFAEKNQREAKATLSQLRFISVDPITGVGNYIKMKDGKAIEPLTLEKGETLIGRGVVSKVDSYGCVVFDDGGSYEPINGYCPNN
ncbi:MAG: hypothetical protein GW890_02900 [Vibrio sp.]|nr:hypothetical protein [Vibrio sp.]